MDKRALEIQKKALMEVKVTGHTDSTGSDAFNKKLSLKRAEPAKSRLSKILPEVEIITKGEGAD
ncbi:OmpA family protein [Fusobacteria bacterium ZRK30]|nr:OmpA family protein [Fusobacteria bacterium ZRK30]